MQFDNSPGVQVVDHQTCVVFDRETGKVVHIHDSITHEGGEIPSKESIEARAMQFTRQFAAERQGVKLDHLEILHVRPEELEDVLAPTVDVKERKLIQANQILPPSLEPEKEAHGRENDGS
jgi:hypothetical protein